jgi:sarcosine oxidase/L-pipecolate oxidase
MGIFDRLASWVREGLFLATGGSGHGYKFLPVIGERIVDVVEGR